MDGPKSILGVYKVHGKIFGTVKKILWSAGMTYVPMGGWFMYLSPFPAKDSSLFIASKVP